MRVLFLVLNLFLFLAVATVEAGHVTGHVGGYTRKDGTYVPDYYRSRPDGNPFNNYGYPGNYNPNTGQTTPGDPDRYLDRYYRQRNRDRGGILDNK